MLFLRKEVTKICKKNTKKANYLAIWHYVFFFCFSAIYDKCIYKFDHYCAWTNNCVGGLNHRYFVGYLATICAMCVNGVVMATKALVVITMRYQLMTLRYVDDYGQTQAMNFRVLIQVILNCPSCVIVVVVIIGINIMYGQKHAYHHRNFILVFSKKLCHSCLYFLNGSHLYMPLLPIC